MTEQRRRRRMTEADKARRDVMQDLKPEPVSGTPSMAPRGVERTWPANGHTFPPSAPLQSLSPGDSITVTLGRECYQPIQYHALELGPYSATTTIRDDETPAQAKSRVLETLQAMVDEDLKPRLATFLDRVRLIGNAARGK